LEYVCTANGRNENAYKVLVGKLEGKRQLETLRYRWEDNIKMHLTFGV
jgi:hypothetical protein